MNGHERHLRSFFDTSKALTNKKYVGRCLYGMVSDTVRAKIKFTDRRISNDYDCLSISLITSDEGKIDQVSINFHDEWGNKRINGNPIKPYLWENDGKLDWYGFDPTPDEMRQITSAVDDYLGVFQDQNLSQAEQTLGIQGQSM